MTDPLTVPAGYRAYEILVPTLRADTNGEWIKFESSTMFVHTDCGALVPDLKAVDQHNRFHEGLMRAIRSAGLGMGGII